MKRLSELVISPAPWKADMSFISSSEGNVCLTIGNEIEMDDKERANARLIAAAPELYEALAAVVSWYERNKPLPYEENGIQMIIHYARKALDKAAAGGWK